MELDLLCKKIIKHVYESMIRTHGVNSALKKPGENECINPFGGNLLNPGNLFFGQPTDRPTNRWQRN